MLNKSVTKIAFISTVKWCHGFLLRTAWTVHKVWIKSQRIRFSVLCTHVIYIKTCKIRSNCTLRMHKVEFIIKFYCNPRTDGCVKRIVGLIPVCQCKSELEMFENTLYTHESECQKA